MWYGLLVERKDLKIALPLVAFLLLLAFVIVSSVLDIKRKEKEEKAYQELLILQEAKKIEEEKAYLMGKFDQAQRPDFVLIPGEYTTLPHQMYLRIETWEAFLRMRAAASM